LPTEYEIQRLAALVESERTHYEHDNSAAAEMAGTPASKLPADVALLAAWTVASNVLLNLDETLTK
jgi:hypothetical protein